MQKVFYWGALPCIVMMVLSGLAIWKPVQLGWLMGGLAFTRIIHFFFMSAIVGFLVMRVTLVTLVPKTLLAMLARVGARRT